MKRTRDLNDVQNFFLADSKTAEVAQ
jgi:hypothetical protein